MWTAESPIITLRLPSSSSGGSREYENICSPSTRATGELGPTSLIDSCAISRHSSRINNRSSLHHGTRRSTEMRKSSLAAQQLRTGRSFQSPERSRHTARTLECEPPLRGEAEAPAHRGAPLLVAELICKLLSDDFLKLFYFRGSQSQGPISENNF